MNMKSTAELLRAMGYKPCIQSVTKPKEEEAPELGDYDFQKTVGRKKERRRACLGWSNPITRQRLTVEEAVVMVDSVAAAGTTAASRLVELGMVALPQGDGHGWLNPDTREVMTPERGALLIETVDAVHDTAEIAWSGDEAPAGE